MAIVTVAYAVPVKHAVHALFAQPALDHTLMNLCYAQNVIEA